MFCSSRALRGLVETSLVTVAHGKKIALVTLNNPSHLNALTVAMGDEFQAAVADIRGRIVSEKVKAAVLTGAGRAFSAGGDVGFLAARIKDTPENNITEMRRFYGRYLSLRTLNVPVIAAVNGHAIGAGLCVALACDMRVVSNKAKLSVNFARLGIHPGMGATYFLPRLIGASTANQLLLTGDTISGLDAERLGIAALATNPEQVVDEAIKIAESVAAASAVAVRTLLETLRTGDATELPAALQREAEAQAACFGDGADLAEALTAISEKRSPIFKD